MNKYILASLITIVSLILLTTPQSITGNTNSNELEGKHYKLRYSSTTTKEQAQELLKFMDEQVFPNYSFLLGMKEEDLSEKALLVLHANMKEYIQAGAPKGSGAYYSPTEKKLVGYYDPIDMKPIFAHEGMHQFTDLAIPKFNQRVPMWYIEGMADCIGNCELRGKTLFICAINSPIAQKYRLPTLKKAFESGKYFKLNELMRLDRGTFMKNGGLCYAESWALCHFLLNAPRKEIGSDRSLKGKYKKVIVEFHNLMAKGDTKLDDAIKKAFVYNGKPIDINELEKEWKEYVLSLIQDKEDKEKKDDKKDANVK